MINITIDASNLFDGGGLTHLEEFLTTCIARNDESIKIRLVGNQKALNTVPSHPYIEKIHHPILETNTFLKAYFRLYMLPKICQDTKTDIVYDPGSGFYSQKIPYVTMSRNMLIFEKKEANRYGFSWQKMRLSILNYLLTKSFNRSTGVIFISKYAHNYIQQLPDISIKNNTIIHHGVSNNFRNTVKSQRDITTYNSDNPFKILYISRIDVYTHQEKLVKAVHLLRQKHYPVELTLIGSSYMPSLNILNKTLSTIPDDKAFIKNLEQVPYAQIAQAYKETDMFVFASSCENMPNILIEAMSAGLPIACSSYGPMQEFLKDAGEYFEPLDVESIANAIEKLILNPELRYKNALKAHNYSLQYSWEKCTNDTLQFIIDAYHKSL